MEFGSKKFEQEGRESRITEPGSPDQVAMFVDLERCIGCFGCEVSCKLEHDLPVGPRRMRVMQVGPKEAGGKLMTLYLPMNCMHCEKPACVEVCPTGAMQKRSDGIVFVDEKVCIGCKSCIIACPSGSPQYNAKTGKVTKCDYCMERVDAGLWPSCATKCAMKALSFGNINELSTVTREKMARRFGEMFFAEKEAKENLVKIKR